MGTDVTPFVMPALETLTAAVTKWRNGATSKKDKQAAYLLSEAQLAISCMEAYCNECRRAYLAALAVPTSCSYLEVPAEITQFVAARSIYPRIGEHIRYLDDIHGLKGTLDEARGIIVAAGQEMLSSVIHPVACEKEAWLVQVLASSGDTPNAVLRLLEFGENLKDRLNPSQPLVANAQIAFAQLRSEILRSHPSLPQPTWQ